MQTAVDQRRQAKSRRVGATKSIAVELKAGQWVVQALDVIITRALRGQPGLLAEWRNVKRVNAKAGRTAVVPQAAASSPSPAPTSSSPAAISSTPAAVSPAATANASDQKMA